MSKMKEMTMVSDTDLSKATKELVKNTKELAKEHLQEEVDPDSVTKMVKAVFVGIFEALKKVF